MIKFPFVEKYSLFTGCDIDVAEEVLGEYNDFLLYNQEEYRRVFKSDDDEASELDDAGTSEGDLSEKEIKEIQTIAERNSDYFKKLFANKDFAESSLFGLKIDYYSLTKIMMEEFRNKVPAEKSAMNTVAPYLRDVASTLVIAGKVVGALIKLSEGNSVLEEVKDNFTKALEILSQGFVLEMPEYTKYKERINTFKTADGFVKMSVRVLEAAESAIKFYTGKESQILKLKQ